MVLGINDFLFLFFILARVAGMFLISPLLTNKAITLTFRLFISLFVAILMSIVLYPNYYGQTALFEMNSTPQGYPQEILLLSIITLKEVIIGYLIGFFFSLIYEAILFAGELIDTMIGFATVQFIDPISNTFTSLLAQLFAFLAFAIILALDLHHVFFRIIAESFVLLPLGTFHMPHVLMEGVTTGGNAMFTFAMQIVAIPFVILSLITVGMGFVMRALPEFNPFLSGFPVRMIIGLFAIAATVSYFPAIIQTAFYELNSLAKIIIESIS